MLSCPPHLRIKLLKINSGKTKIECKSCHHGAQLWTLYAAEPQQVTRAMNLLDCKLGPVQVIMIIRAHATDNPGTDVANLQPPNAVLAHA